MTTIDHQQAAVLAGAEALWKADHTCFGAPAPKTSAEWADETVGYTEDSRAVIAAATPHLRAAWEQEASDEYHTFAELYEYRMLYDALAANATPHAADRMRRALQGTPHVTRIPDEAINAGVTALHQHAALYDNECECGEGLSWDAYQAHKVQKIVEAALPYVKEDQ